MSIYTIVIQGNSVQLNKLDNSMSSAKMVEIPATFNNQHTYINIDEKTLSKHTLLIGGTGSGKTNTFY